MPIQRPATRRHRSNLFTEALEILEEAYATDLCLDDVARRVASSRRQLQRSFSEVGHTTFRDEMTAVRMRKAAALLGDSPMTVREVAHRVGYRQPAQFAKAFRRHHGLAPSAYRTHEALHTPRGAATTSDSGRLAALDQAA